MRYDNITIIMHVFTWAQKLTGSQFNMPQGTRKTNKKSSKEDEKHNAQNRRNGPVIKSVESVLKSAESLWWEIFVKE